VHRASVLRRHDVTLQKGRIVLRPLTEDDWSTLLRWNSDPEVLHFSEGDDAKRYDLAQVQAIYRGVSQNAYCFVIEFTGRAIGECWLQRMNLERILARYPGQDCRRGHQEVTAATAGCASDAHLGQWCRAHRS